MPLPTPAFIFIDGNDNPIDIDGDHYLDTAFTETYYNQTFGQSGTDRVSNPWAINLPLRDRCSDRGLT